MFLEEFDVKLIDIIDRIVPQSPIGIFATTEIIPIKVDGIIYNNTGLVILDKNSNIFIAPMKKIYGLPLSVDDFAIPYMRPVVCITPVQSFVKMCKAHHFVCMGGFFRNASDFLQDYINSQSAQSLE